MIENGKRYLITTDNWFVAPDGEQYKAVWGTCQVLTIKEVFGFDPLRPSTNWYISVGTNRKEMIVAGCQLHYAIRCEERPKENRDGVTYTDKEDGLEHSANRIYYAE